MDHVNGGMMLSSAARLSIHQWGRPHAETVTHIVKYYLGGSNFTKHHSANIATRFRSSLSVLLQTLDTNQAEAL